MKSIIKFPDLEMKPERKRIMYVLLESRSITIKFYIFKKTINVLNINISNTFSKNC